MRKGTLFIGLLAVMGSLNWVRADETVSCAACQGQTLETPNQRRIRLGQPITESFPAQDYGEKLETPNQRRKRLGIALPADTNATSAAAQGVSEETPNQKRARLALSALSENR